MIELYSTNLTSTSNMVVPWNTKAVQTGAATTLGTDGSTILLRYPGIYEVSVNGYGETTEAGTFGFQLNGSNGAITRGAANSATTAGDNVNVSFSTAVRVTTAAIGNIAELSVSYTGSPGTISLTNIIVKKIG